MTEFGIAHVWGQGDWVIRTVALILLAMSITTWSIILMKIFSFLSLNQAVIASKEKFWSEHSLHKAINKLGNARYNPFRELAIAGSAAVNHQSTYEASLSQSLDLSEWIARSLKYSMDECSDRLQRGLGFLASIGSTAPFIGLLGTVWGIYHALQTISSVDQPDIAHVAGPVGEALVMTAFGLFVAIPAVLGFNTISRRNRGVTHAASRFAHDLHAFYLTGARVNAVAGNLKHDVMAAENTSSLVQPLRSGQSI